MSYIGSERRDQLENMHAGFEHAQSPIPPSRNLEDLVAQLVEEQLSMRHPSSSASEDLHVNFAMDDKLKDAMKYQSKIDHVGHANRRDTLTDLPNIPLTQAALRRNAGVIPSLSGSSRSKRSSDEDPSIISAGHRLTTGSEVGGLTVNGDEMKMRIDTAHGFEMEFDGRIVTLQPIGDGTSAELIIGGKNQARTETAYMSARGSTATKSVINRQPSQRQRRNTRTLNELDEDEDDDRTERRTVYTREERRRDREERQRDLEAREAREAREDRRERRARLEREAVEREREALEREREELKREQERHDRQERKERKERKRREGDQQRRDRERKRNSRYEEEELDDYTSDSYTSEDDRRTQRTARRPRAKTYEEKRERRRPASPERERRPRDDGNYNYPPGYGQRAGFSTQPPAF
jgi:hypothetical protein